MKSDHLLSSEKCKDAGLALVLICLICYLIWELPVLVLLAVVFLVAAMTWPPIFKPFAKLWFGLSTALGTVVSKIILSLLFFGLVLPVGLIRKALGKDAMKIKDWKKAGNTVFRIREYRFSAKDMENPY